MKNINYSLFAAIFMTSLLLAPASYALEADLNNAKESTNEAASSSTQSDGMSQNLTKSEVETRVEQLASLAEHYTAFGALRAAVESVDAQIPDWEVWREIPYAINQVHLDSCFLQAGSNPFPINIGCNYSLGGILISEMTNVEFLSDEWENSAEVKRLLALPIAQLLTEAKSSPKYNTDQEYAKIVNEDQQIYDYGLSTLRSSVAKLHPSVTDVNNLTVDQLISDLRSDPYYQLYDLPLPMTSGTDFDSGLYNTYAWAQGEINLCELSIRGCDPNNGIIANNPEDEQSLISNYRQEFQALVSAALRAYPDFIVDFTSAPLVNSPEPAPTAPNTGSTGLSDSAATVIKIATGVIAAFTAIIGLALVIKCHLFSPLKRRK